MGVSPLITVGHFREYARFAASQGRQGRVAYDRVSQQHVLLARGYEANLTGVRVLANADMANANLDYTHANVVQIAPEGNWLDALSRAHPIFGRDDTPVVLVSSAEIFGFVQWLNEQLLEERQAGRIPTGAFFMVPSGDELEYLMRGPEGTNEFGRQDGQAPDLSKRPYPNIEGALRDDTGVRWGANTIRGLCGVLWQWARDRYQNSATVGLGGGSWGFNVQDNFHAVCRSYYNLDSRSHGAGFRLVLPRTP